MFFFLNQVNNNGLQHILTYDHLKAMFTATDEEMKEI